MPIQIVRILGAPIRAHAAHFFCATGVPSRNSRILKNRPKMPSQGSERPSFGRFLGSSTQCRRCHYFHARICAHAAHAFAEYRGEATSRDLKGMGRRCPWRSKIPLLLSIFRSPRFSRTRCTRLRAEGAHVLTGFKESAQDALLRGSKRLPSPISPILRVGSQCDGNPLILCSPRTRAHAAHVYPRDRVLSRNLRIKELPDAFRRLQEAFLCLSLAFPHNAGVNNLFDTHAAQA
jgi:hypothetical protein